MAYHHVHITVHLCSTWTHFFIYFQVTTSPEFMWASLPRKVFKKKSRKTITTSAAAGLRVPVKAYCVPPPLTILDSPFCFWWPGLPGRVAQVIIPEICPLVIIPFPYWVCCTCPSQLIKEVPKGLSGTPGCKPYSFLSLLCNTALHPSYDLLSR